MQKVWTRDLIMLKLKEKYIKEVVPGLQKQFGYKNKMLVPKIEKVVINIGFGRFVAGQSSSDRKKIQQVFLDDLILISGQKPQLTKAKKSIAGFKIRQGMAIGTAVTLRKKMMYDFLDRLIHISLPRTRDFQGIKANSVDKHGNLTIGIKEHIAFPEISPEKAKDIFSLEATVVSTADNQEQGLALFKLLGFPIKNGH